MIHTVDLDNKLSNGAFPSDCPSINQPVGPIVLLYCNKPLYANATLRSMSGKLILSSAKVLRNSMNIQRSIPTVCLPQSRYIQRHESENVLL